MNFNPVCEYCNVIGPEVKYFGHHFYHWKCWFIVKCFHLTGRRTKAEIAYQEYIKLLYKDFINSQEKTK